MSIRLLRPFLVGWVGGMVGWCESYRVAGGWGGGGLIGPHPHSSKDWEMARGEHLCLIVRQMSLGGN